MTFSLEVPVEKNPDGTYTQDPKNAVLSNPAGVVATGPMALFLGQLALTAAINAMPKEPTERWVR